MAVRRICSVIVFLVLLVAVIGCSEEKSPYKVIYSMEKPVVDAMPESTVKAPDPVKGDTHTIAIVPKAIDIAYFRYAAEGALEAGRELDIEVIVDGPQKADAEEQIKVVKRLIDRGVDLIAISANDPVKLVPILNEARAKGIRVITWDADTQTEARDFFVNMVEPEALGRHLMDTVANAMGEKGKFAIMTGSLSAANLNEWLDWIQYQQREYYPDMELLEIVETDDDLNKAYDVAERLIMTYPDLGGILGNSSVGPPAAARVVRAAGKAGEIKVVGLSNPNLMRVYLQDGSAQSATLWSPKKLGYLTAVLSHQLLCGEMPHDGQEIYSVGKIRMKGDMVIMGEPLDFTKENVDQYDF